MPAHLALPPDPLDLLVDGRRAARLEVARTRRTQAHGLLGRTSFDGALLLPHVRSVHTVGMRFAIDVALCDEHLQVLQVRTVAPQRLLLPRSRVRHVVEAGAGAFERWGIVPGGRLATVAAAGQRGSPAGSTCPGSSGPG